MKKYLTLPKISFLQRIKYKLFEHPFTPIRTRLNIQRISSQISRKYYDGQDDDKKIYRYKIFDFTNPNCLFQWQGIQDKEFGGSSTHELFFDEAKKKLILKGKISTQNRDKIITMPFIGLLQKSRFSIKVQEFNALAVTLKSDGLPLQVEISFISPFFGECEATGRIISKSTEENTYELPFLNFLIKGEEDTIHKRRKRSEINTMKNIIEDENLKKKDFKFTSVSFRVHATKEIDRKIQLSKIQLVKTERATFKSHCDYMKPYFYITNEKDEYDEEQRTRIDTGDLVFEKEKRSKF